MKKALTIIAVAAAAVLLAGAVWWYIYSGECRNFDYRMILI